MLDANELRDNVLEAIANNMDLDAGDESTIKKISRLSPNEAFDKFLNWHGIIGYSDMIRSALDNIRAAERR
jgi:hypothetical protein